MCLVSMAESLIPCAAIHNIRVEVSDEVLRCLPVVGSRRASSSFYYSLPQFHQSHSIALVSSHWPEESDRCQDSHREPGKHCVQAQQRLACNVSADQKPKVHIWCFNIIVVPTTPYPVNRPWLWYLFFAQAGLPRIDNGLSSDDRAGGYVPGYFDAHHSNFASWREDRKWKF